MRTHLSLLLPELPQHRQFTIHLSQTLIKRPILIDMVLLHCKRVMPRFHFYFFLRSNSRRSCIRAAVVEISLVKCLQTASGSVQSLWSQIEYHFLASCHVDRRLSEVIHKPIAWHIIARIAPMYPAFSTKIACFFHIFLFSLFIVAPSYVTTSRIGTALCPIWISENWASAMVIELSFGFALRARFKTAIALFY